MNRRVVRQDLEFEAVREANSRTVRRFKSGQVLNILQWVHRGEARFTVEGEGAEVWVCPEPQLQESTVP